MPRKLLPYNFGQLRGRQNVTRGGKGKRFAQMPTRLQQIVKNNLGIIMTTEMSQNLRFRSADLDLLDQYYENTQYDNLQPWDDAVQVSGDYVAIRKRKPRIIYNVAKVLTDKVASKLVGEKAFPQFHVDDDPEDTDFLRVVQKACKFRRSLLKPTKMLLLAGSVFVRYFFVDGILKITWSNSKYCYPTLDAAGELVDITIRYVFEDKEDRDNNGKSKQKWYQCVLTRTADIEYDNPEYKEGTKPTFQEVSRNEHDLGWVQGEWFRTSEEEHTCDGVSLVGDILGFIDELNYSLSQTSQAIAYNQEPQLGVNNIDEDELDALIKSSQKAWNLGREGKAAFVESTMKGVEAASEQRDRFRAWMLDVVRVVIHDPEKIVGNAQSAKAMEVLYGPLVELVDELRTELEPQYINLLTKISMTFLVYNARGFETSLEIAPGYMPQSMEITAKWPAMFPPTLDDIVKMSQAANTLNMGQILAKETLTRWIAPVFDVEDIDEELKKIAAQPPPPNPFGGFNE